MSFGYQGKILRVDLSTGKNEIEEPGELFYRTYWGGACLGAYFLLKEMKGGEEPFSPSNLLIFATGPLTGVPVPGLAKHSVLAKSPLTGGIGESQSEGFWGSELKLAGFDALIIKGRSDKPVYLWIHNGQLRIKDASHIWGKVTGQAYNQIKEELGDKGCRIALIGPAGERRVRFASIVYDLIFASYRNGLGAVMGSKNLKAVAVRGEGTINFKDREVLERISKDFHQHFLENPISRLQYEYGPAGAVKMVLEDGQLVTRNFTQGTIEGWKDIPGVPGYKRFFQRNQGCFACPNNCKQIIKPARRGEVELEGIYGGPEFDTAVALGSNCGITDTFTMLRAGELCQKYSLDPTSLGGTMALGMECFERGIINRGDTDGLELRFGNGDALLKIIEMVAYGEGIGNVLSEGSLRAARNFGREALRLAVQTKGKELPMHDPRAKAALGLGYAVSPIGPDFAIIEHDSDFDFSAPQQFIDEAGPLSIYYRLPAESLEDKKIRMFHNLQLHWSFMEVIGGCIFATAPVRYLKLPDLVEVAVATTGWQTSFWDLMKVGERRINMFRIFNLREGFTCQDDWLPERAFESIQGGPRQGQKINRDELRKAIQLYYEMMNWDSEGVPRPAKLIELDLTWLKAGSGLNI